MTPHTDGQPDGAPEDSAPAQEGVRETFARLYADGRAYAAAEVDKQKFRAGIIGAGIRNVAIFGIVALMVAFATIVALLVGLTIALAQLVAPLWATLIVVGGGLLAILILLLAAKGAVTRMKKAIAP